MKVLLISRDYFPPQVGGISNVMASIGASFGSDRLCCLTGVRIQESGFQSDYRVYRRPAVFSRNRFIRVTSLAATMAQIMVIERPTIVHLASVQEGYLGLLLKRLLGLPFVVYCHGNEISALVGSNIGWRKPKESLRHAHAVIAVSEFTAKLAVNAGAPPERVTVVHPGCDTSFFRPVTPDKKTANMILGKQKNGPIILTVGNLVERKGHDMVLRSMPSLIRHIPDLTYLVVGDGTYRQSLEQLAGELGVSRHVVFAGQLPTDMLPKVYSLSDIFVMPSRHILASHDVEGFGLVFLEASACGLPVIGGRSGGIPEAIDDGVSGFLVNPESTNELTERLCWLLTNPEKSRQMGTNGLNRVRSSFRWDRIPAMIAD